MLANWMNQLASLRRIGFDSNALIYLLEDREPYADLRVRSVDRTVAQRAARVRAQTRLDPLDAIIVATALEERCDAMIGNDSFIASRSIGIPYLYLNDYIR